MATKRNEAQNTIQETTVNVLAEGTRIEGKISLDRISRIHGALKGQISAKDGSTVILCETSTVEGSIHADVLMIDGFVQGDIFAKNRVVISRTGRVIGTIDTPSLKIEFGGYFEGQCRMGAERPVASTQTLLPPSNLLLDESTRY